MARLTHAERRTQDAAALDAALQTGTPPEARRHFEALGGLRQHEADTGFLIREMFGGEFSPSKLRPGVKLDPRTMDIFCPEFDYEDTTEAGAAKKEAAEKFVSEYILDGSPEARKSHLDRMFDELENSSLPTRDLLSHFGEGISSQEGMQLAKSCYLQNVIADNPEYAAARFDTPQKRERMEALMIYSAPYSGARNYFLASFDIKADRGVMQPGLARMFASGLAGMAVKAEISAAMYENKIAVLDGRETAMTVDAKFTNVEGTNARDIFALKAASDKGQLVLRAPGIDYAAAQYSEKFMDIFDSDQKKKMEIRGLDEFDLIYINGVSANEKFGAKYADKNPAERGKLIKAEIMSAMVNDQAKIDVTPVMMDKDGKEKLVPISVKPSIKEIQKPPNWFQRTFPRIFKSEDAKLQAANERNASASNAKLNESIQRNEERAAAKLGEPSRSAHMREPENVSADLNRSKAPAASRTKQTVTLERTAETGMGGK